MTTHRAGPFLSRVILSSLVLALITFAGSALGAFAGLWVGIWGGIISGDHDFVPVAIWWCAGAGAAVGFFTTLAAWLDEGSLV